MSFLFLTACSERDLQIAFLNSSMPSDSQFKITNVVNEDYDILPDSSEDHIPVEATCSKRVRSIEIQNPATLEWKAVSELDSEGDTECASDGQVSFKLPVSYAVPHTPENPGDFRQNFQLRWMMGESESADSSQYYYRGVAAVFKAPSVAVNAGNINISSTTEDYTVSGTCSASSGLVKVDSIFVGTVTTTCTNGTFSITKPLSPTLMSGLASFTVTHYTPSSRAFTTYVKSLMIDLDAPIIAIDAPTEGEKLTQDDISEGGTFQVTGICSEYLEPVSIEVDGALWGSVTCTSLGSFNAEMSLTDGYFVIRAMQTDSAGNLGSSSFRAFEKDTTGPGTFQIFGVRSDDSDDVTLDGLLTSLRLRVDYSTSSGAVGYKIKVKDNNGVDVCPEMEKTASSSYGNYANTCTLQDGLDYKAFVTAIDIDGNRTEVSKKFVVQLPQPVIVDIYGTVTNHTYTEEAFQVFLKFDRAITVIESPKVDFNSGQSLALQTTADPKILVVSFPPTPNLYVPILDITGFNLAMGSLKDAVNGKDASLVLPTDPATHLSAKNIKIDSEPPGSVTNLSVGLTSSLITVSPTILFTEPQGEPEPISMWLTISEHPNGPVVYPTSNITASPVGPLPLNAELVRPGTTYRVDIQVKDPAGNYSEVKSALFTSQKCPPNFAYVYEPSKSAQPFCVAQFETSGVIGNPSFAPGPPIVGMTFQEAKDMCANLGYRLIKNDEWNAVATAIANQGSNWTNGTPLNGHLHRGNSSVETIHAPNLNDPCYPANASICTGGGHRRTHNLPYGQVVWDMAGNAIELVNFLDNTKNTGREYISNLSNLSTVFSLYGAPSNCETHAIYPYCGYGVIWYDNVVSEDGDQERYVWRGGSNVIKEKVYDVGVFAAAIRVENFRDVDGGFRCTANPTSY